MNVCVGGWLGGRVVPGAVGIEPLWTHFHIAFAQACGLSAYPFATSYGVLIIFRLLFAVGAASAAAMMTAVLADYVVLEDKGKVLCVFVLEPVPPNISPSATHVLSHIQPPRSGAASEGSRRDGMAMQERSAPKRFPSKRFQPKRGLRRQGPHLCWATTSPGPVPNNRPPSNNGSPYARDP